MQLFVYLSTVRVFVSTNVCALACVCVRALEMFAYSAPALVPASFTRLTEPSSSCRLY